MSQGSSQVRTFFEIRFTYREVRCGQGYGSVSSACSRGSADSCPESEHPPRVEEVPRRPETTPARPRPVPGSRCSAFCLHESAHSGEFKKSNRTRVTSRDWLFPLSWTVQGASV